MPQIRHKEWEGFKRLIQKDDNGKPLPGKRPKAQCEKCGKIFSKTEQEFMKNHKGNCGKENGSTPMKRLQGTRQSTPFQERSESSNSSNVISSDDHASGIQVELSSDESTQHSISFTRNSSTLCEGFNLVAPRERERSLSNEISRHSSNEEASPIFGRKRGFKRPKNSLNEEEATNDDKCIGIYKFFLCADIDFDNASLRSFVDLLKLFDRDFCPPSVQDLYRSVSKKASERVYQSNHSKQHNSIMQLIVEVVKGRVEVAEDGDIRVNSDTILAMILLGSCKKDWTYINHMEFESAPWADFAQTMEVFCDEAVLKVKEEYNIQPLFVIHSGLCKLKEIRDVDTEEGDSITYYRLCEIESVIDKLKSNLNLVCNMTNMQIVPKFYEDLQSIITKSVQTSMSDSIQDLFEAINMLDSENQETVSNKLSAIIGPVHLSAKVFQPKYHKKIIDQPVHKCTKKVLIDFYQKYAPPVITIALPYYLQKTGDCFTTLYARGNEGNAEHFWSVVKLDQNLPNAILFADYALQLLQIPASLKKIKLQELFEKRKKYVGVSDDFNCVLFTYLLEE